MAYVSCASRHTRLNKYVDKAILACRSREKNEGTSRDPQRWLARFWAVQKEVCELCRERRPCVRQPCRNCRHISSSDRVLIGIADWCCDCFSKVGSVESLSSVDSSIEIATRAWEGEWAKWQEHLCRGNDALGAGSGKDFLCMPSGSQNMEAAVLEISSMRRELLNSSLRECGGFVRFLAPHNTARVAFWKAVQRAREMRVSPQGSVDAIEVHQGSHVANFCKHAGLFSTTSPENVTHSSATMKRRAVRRKSPMEVGVREIVEAARSRASEIPVGDEDAFLAASLACLETAGRAAQLLLQMESRRIVPKLVSKAFAEVACFEPCLRRRVDAAALLLIGRPVSAAEADFAGKEAKEEALRCEGPVSGVDGIVPFNATLLRALGRRLLSLYGLPCFAFSTEVARDLHERCLSERARRETTKHPVDVEAYLKIENEVFIKGKYARLSLGEVWAGDPVFFNWWEKGVSEIQKQSVDSWMELFGDDVEDFIKVARHLDPNREKIAAWFVEQFADRSDEEKRIADFAAKKDEKSTPTVEGKKRKRINARKKRVALVERRLERRGGLRDVDGGVFGGIN
eukprot:TRINITY_DN43392_c0_g1_i1.p1 TRINITY_DN43392_c0_g1~~TRINITY_DN43392_c0_g1_i1.p1  ORF type:complete len:666 (-),score=98.60 TRINITY_DN43392_c0_g1_i1:36-1751(-)